MRGDITPFDNSFSYLQSNTTSVTQFDTKCGTARCGYPDVRYLL